MNKGINIGNIRTADLDDAPQILAIFLKCDLFTGSIQRKHNISLIDVMDWLEIATDKHPMLVFEDNSQVIGWCSIEPFYGLPAFDGASEISLYVSPEYQSNGIGTRIFQYLEKHRNQIGLTHLVAYIYSSNLNSQCFFKRQGFEQWGLLPNIAQGEHIKEDVYLLGREF